MRSSRRWARRRRLPRALTRKCRISFFPKAAPGAGCSLLRRYWRAEQHCSSILPFLLFYFQSSGMGVIGGADGPTAIFITGAANLLAPVLTPLWLAVPFILGCCAACVLLRWGAKRAACKAYACFDVFRRRFAVLAPVGHIVLVAGFLRGGRHGGIAVLSWKTLLFQLFNLMLLPSFWLPVVTLCIAARRRKTASPRQ